MAHAAADPRPTEVSKRAEWARVLVTAGGVLVTVAPFLSWSDGWIDGHSAVWRSVLNGAYALGSDGMFWAVLLVTTGVLAVVLALWRFPDRSRWALTNRIGLLVIAGIWLSIWRWASGETTCFTIGPCDGVAPRLLLAAVPLVVLGALLMPSNRQARGGRMGSIAVGVVLAVAVGGGLAAVLAPQEQTCHGCDDPEAQARLRDAYSTAETYLRKHGTFSDFGPREAVKLMPGLEWTGSDGVSKGPTEIVIREADELSLLLVVRSDQGDFLCVSRGAPGVPPGSPAPTDPLTPSFGWSPQDIPDRNACIYAPGWPKTGAGA